MKPLSWYRDLADPRKRAAAGCFLVEGPRAVSQVALVSPGSIVEVLVDEAYAGDAPFAGSPVRRLTARQFSSIAGAKAPQGIAAVVKIPDACTEGQLPADPGENILLLDGIQDPGNVGTLIRTAAALGFGGVILTPSCADPLGPKAVQATAGSILSLWFRRTDRFLDLARTLKDRKFLLFAAALEGTPIAECHVSGPLVLMLGSEGSGLSAPLLAIGDVKVTIPMDRRKVESLNVAVSGGIVMARLGNANNKVC
jgi:TrmH family RNA methyltransferase